MALTKREESWHILCARVQIKVCGSVLETLTLGNDEMDGHKDQIVSHPQPLVKGLVHVIP